MRNLKRALSLALASVMLLGMMVVGTSAVSYPDVDENDNVEAIEVLNAVNVMIGDRGNFRPDAKVNRHEMAVIMAKLVLGNDVADNYVGGTLPFTDVFPWAEKYVAACYENGITKGTSGTTYGGNQPLTAVEAAGMMLNALGYKDLNKGASDWRAPLVAMANQLRLFNGVTSNPKDQLNRNQVAQLVLNTLKSSVVDLKDGTFNISDGNGQLIVSGGNREYIVRSSREAYAYAINDTENAGTSASSVSGATVELGEHLYNGSLKLYDDRTDVFGRPARKWEYDGKAIGTYAKDELLRQEYVGKVTGRNLYDLLGSETIRDYDITVTIDGISNKAIDSNVFTRADMNKNNNATVGATGTGTLTQVYVDTQNKDVYISVINTYLAIAEDDYDEKKEELSVTAYALKKTGSEYIKSRTSGEDSVPAIKLSIEDFNVASVKKDDALLITVADGDVQTAVPAEVLSGVQLSAFKKGSNVTTNGTKYEYTTTAEFKHGDLDVYTNSGAGGSINLKDLTYNIYLDAYDNLIGIEEVESVNNYMFIAGIDTNGSNIANTTADANVLFLDGTSETVKINLAKSILTLKNGSDNSILNTWCTYTKNNSGVYTVTQVKDANVTSNNVPNGSNNLNGKLAQYHQTVAADRTIDQRNITLDGRVDAGSYNKVYGNKDTVYLTAELDELTNSKTYGVISGVENVTTGVTNANLTVWPVATAAKEADDSKTSAAPNTATSSNGVYTLYNNDGVIIAAVVVGEDAAAAKNLVYVHSSGLEEEAYASESARAAGKGDWTWTRKVIQDGKEVLLTEVGDSSTYLEPMAQYQWYQIKLNANNEVVGQELASKALTNSTTGDYVNLHDATLGNTVINGKDTVLYHSIKINSGDDDGFVGKLILNGNTLFVDTTLNHGFVVDQDVNVVLQQWDKNTKETYIETGVGVAKLKSFINEINQYASSRGTINTASAKPYYVSAILEKGIAKTVVLYDTYNSYVRPDDPTVITENVSATVDGNVVKVVFTDKNFNALDLRNAASNALKAAGYTSVNTFTLTVPTPDGAASSKGVETPVPGYVMAMDSEKDMTFFTVTYINYWTLKVDGQVIEYMEHGVKTDSTWGDVFALTGKTVGTGCVITLTNDGYKAYNAYTTPDTTIAWPDRTVAPIIIESGYVTVTKAGLSNNTNGTWTVAGTEAVTGAEVIKVGETLTATFKRSTDAASKSADQIVEVKATGAAGKTPSTTGISLTQTMAKDDWNSATAQKEMAFAFSTAGWNADVTLADVVAKDKPADATIALGTHVEANGITISNVTLSTTKAKVGEVVSVTATIKGPATADGAVGFAATTSTAGVSFEDTGFDATVSVADKEGLTIKGGVSFERTVTWNFRVGATSETVVITAS